MTDTTKYRAFKVDELSVKVFRSLDDLSSDAATEVHGYLQEVLARQGAAAAILATGNSQIQFLKKLVAMPGIDWSKVTLFHMDEYLGIDAGHKATGDASGDNSITGTPAGTILKTVYVMQKES